jgi:hypothetical protein
MTITNLRIKILTRHRLVIKDLRKPAGEIGIEVGANLSQKDALDMQRRFIKLKWDERRPGVYTIDHVALVVEPDYERKE